MLGSSVAFGNQSMYIRICPCQSCLGPLLFGFVVLPFPLCAGTVREDAPLFFLFPPFSAYSGGKCCCQGQRAKSRLSPLPEAPRLLRPTRLPRLRRRLPSSPSVLFRPIMFRAWSKDPPWSQRKSGSGCAVTINR